MLWRGAMPDNKKANYPNLQRTEIESYILNEFKIFFRYKNGLQD